MIFRRSLLGVPILLFAAVGTAWSQQWPSRNITLVVSFAPGGSTDLTARLVGAKLRNELGQPVVVDNRAGAGGSVGAGSVAKAAPDGYTLLMAVSSHAINANLFKNLPFSMKTDFVPVGQIAAQPLVLVVNKDFPARSLPELISYIRDNKGPVNYASAGVGTNYHLGGAWLNNMAQGRMVHIAYKGGAPATTAVVSGEVQVLIGVITELLPHIKSGSVRALAITTKSRSPHLPDVPALDEVLPGYDLGTWSGILAPAGTPPQVVARLNSALNKVLQDAEVQATIAAQGSQVVAGTPEAFGEVVAKELEKAAALVKLSGAVAE